VTTVVTEDQKQPGQSSEHKELAALMGLPVVERHQGQRTYDPRQKAGHMNAADQIIQSVNKGLPL
jgi:hypothetical protein